MKGKYKYSNLNFEMNEISAHLLLAAVLEEITCIMSLQSITFKPEFRIQTPFFHEGWIRIPVFHQGRIRVRFFLEVRIWVIHDGRLRFLLVGRIRFFLEGRIRIWVFLDGRIRIQLLKNCIGCQAMIIRKWLRSDGLS